MTGDYTYDDFLLDWHEDILRHGLELLERVGASPEDLAEARQLLDEAILDHLDLRLKLDGSAE